MPDWSDKRKQILKKSRKNSKRTTTTTLKPQPVPVTQPLTLSTSQLTETSSQTPTNEPQTHYNHSHYQSTTEPNSLKEEKMEHQQQQHTPTLATPKIVERVQKIPVVSLAFSMGFEQYDKLKSSNVTVGEVMKKAENIALYFWQKVAPIVEKLPINRADQLVCNTIDYVEGKLSHMNIVTKQKEASSM